MDNLLAVVLCGGESRRMGSDKGLLTTGNGESCWAARMGDKLTPWQLPVFYSINEGQQQAYSRVLPPDRLITDSSRLPGLHGPLRGLLSLHEKFPDRDLLLLACDMRDLDRPTIGKITETYKTCGQAQWEDPDLPTSQREDFGLLIFDHPVESACPDQQGQEERQKREDQYDFFVYRDAAFFQPFCGIYTTRGLAAIYRLAVEGRLGSFSLQPLLQGPRTKSLPMENPAAFRNYNAL